MNAPQTRAKQRLKYVASLNDEALAEDTNPNFDLSYIDIGNVDSSGTIHNCVNYRFENAPSRARRIVRHGDVIISTVRTYLQAIAPIENPPENLIVSTGFAVVRPRKGVLEPVFCKYILRESEFLAEVEKHSVGVSYPAINASDLGSIFVPLPPLEEQRAIAKMLDAETARLDELIAEKERLLALLAEKRRALITRAVTRGLDAAAPVRESGLQWLGDIPEHWDIPPVYARYKVQLGKMLDEKQIRGTHPACYLRNIDVQWGNINTKDLPVMDFDEDDRKAFSLKYGDILICEGGEIGRAAIWREAIDNCYYQKALHRLRPATENDFPDFFVFAMRAMVDTGVFLALSTASTIHHLPAEKLRVIRYPAPPLEEQRAIVDYITAESRKLDDLRDVTKSTVGLLRERRAALIAAAVTGQIDVKQERQKPARQ